MKSKTISLYVRAFREYGLKYKYRMLLLLFISVLLALFALVSPFFTRLLVDAVVTSKNAKLLNQILVGMIAVIILSSGLGLLRTYLTAVFSQKIGFDIKFDFYRHLHNLSIFFYGEKRVGDLLYRMFNDTQVVCGSVGTTIVGYVLNFFTAIIIILWMLHMNAGMSLFVFTVFILHILLIIKFQRPIRILTKKFREQEEDIYGTVKEKLDGIQLVQSSGTKEKEVNEFHFKLHNLVKVAIKNSLVGGLSDVSTATVTSLWSFGVLWYGGHSVIRGTLTIGELMAFVLLCQMLFPTMTSITNSIINFPAIMVSLFRFFEIRDHVPTIQEAEDALPQVITEGTISLKDISFKYPKQSGNILKNISLDIGAKERIALVGRSGVGKTTLVNLIARFLDPSEGSITIDGLDIKKFQIKSLRDAIGFVLQNFFVFSGSILDNIRYGNPNASFDAVVAAAKIANVHEHIISLPKGYEAEIGERGLQISTGEAQRIALARVFLKNPKILILDEATSFIDVQTESLIQRAVADISKERTTIIIAHRLTTAKQADRIMFLENGTIVECGSHQELLEKQGLYSKFWNIMLAGY